MALPSKGASYRFDTATYAIEDPTLHISFSETPTGCSVVDTPREEGAPIVSSTYLDHHLHGPSYGYFPDGTRATEKWFYHGLAHGRSLEYAPSGALVSQRGYVQGRLEGPYLRWYPNGTPQLSGFFRNGVPDGTFELFVSDGSILRTTSFSNGRRHGMDTGWTNDGFLLFCERWKEGVRLQTILPDYLSRSLGLDVAAQP